MKSFMLFQVRFALNLTATFGVQSFGDVRIVDNRLRPWLSLNKVSIRKWRNQGASVSSALSSSPQQEGALLGSESIVEGHHYGKKKKC